MTPITKETLEDFGFIRDNHLSDQIKEHYPNMAMKKATIKPDLPQKKSVEELFALAQQKLAMESTQVILILDMDSIIKDHQEFERFRVYYEK